MKSKRLANYLSLHEEGCLSSNEVANSVLHELLSEPELDLACLSSIGSLPVGVQEAFLDLLRRIRAADYQWKPFMIGSGPRPEHPEYPGKLREICAFLGVP